MKLQIQARGIRAWKAVRALIADFARAVGADVDGDADGVGGKEGLDELGPFHQADAVRAVEVVLVADVIDFGEAADAIEVEVVDGAAGGGGVFVDDGEGGRGDDVGGAEGFADGTDEGGLAGAHGAVEGEEAALAHVVHKSTGGGVDIGQFIVHSS